MPRKIRELIRDLLRAGFNTGAGAEATATLNTRAAVRVTLSGNPGDDAKPYQEREVKSKIEEAQP